MPTQHDERPGQDPSGKAERRRALQALTRSIRSLCDVAVATNIEPAEVDAVTRELDGLRKRLAESTHDGPYSGLLGRNADYSDPQAMLPLSPIIGPFNPVAPDVELHFEGDRVVGRAMLGKKHVGPPGCAHGGVSAMIADQLVALAGTAGGVRGVTRSLNVRFRRPTPLNEELELEGWCRERGEGRAIVTAEIRAGGEVRVEIEGEVVEARRLTHPDKRKADRAPSE